MDVIHQKKLFLSSKKFAAPSRGVWCVIICILAENFFPFPSAKAFSEFKKVHANFDPRTPHIYLYF